MNDQLAKTVGDRVRFYRTAARMTKTVLAGLCGITPDYLYQIERGQKLPALPMLARLADVLRVDLGELISHAPSTMRLPQPRTAGDAIYRALTSPAPSADTSTDDNVEHTVSSTWTTWQTSPQRYSKLTTQLPRLIARTEAALRASDAPPRRDAQRQAADLYGLLRTVTKRIGRSDLSLLAADRALRAAEAADDPLRLAAARWNLAQILLADDNAEGAESIAMRAAGDLQPLVAGDDLDAIVPAQCLARRVNSSGRPK